MTRNNTEYGIGQGRYKTIQEQIQITGIGQGRYKTRQETIQNTGIGQGRYKTRQIQGKSGTESK